jgi:cellulose 1,4-beta-cellobiosidase
MELAPTPHDCTPANLPFSLSLHRNGVIGLRDAWGDWCNVDGAGIGVRPTSSTGLALADAFVWVKPAGESDGTSDTTATRYDSFCGLPDAHQPMPEAGTWSQEYFEMLLQNAVPSF